MARVDFNRSLIKRVKWGYWRVLSHFFMYIEPKARCAWKNGQNAPVPPFYPFLFSMTLCDKDTSSTIRAVSFDENMYERFKTTATYDLKCFKVKKGFRNEEIEPLISREVEVNESLFQFAIEKTTFKVAQILRRETTNVRFFTLKAKVIFIDDATMVGKPPNEKLMREVQLGDETGFITLVLWRQRAELESLMFKQDDVVVIENAVSSTFNKNVVLTTAEETSITISSEEIQFEVATEPLKKNSKVTSLETNIAGVKDFRCQWRCVNCRRDVDWVVPQAAPINYASTSSAEHAELGFVTCPTCSTYSQATPNKLKNDCKLLLSSNNQWFVVGTTVSL